MGQWTTGGGDTAAQSRLIFRTPPGGVNGQTGNGEGKVGAGFHDNRIEGGGGSSVGFANRPLTKGRRKLEMPLRVAGRRERPFSRQADEEPMKKHEKEEETHPDRL
jgi:hypothetical protein